MTTFSVVRFFNNPANIKPRYFSDLYWTHPFGAGKMLNILDKLIGLWETGEKEWRGMLAMRMDRVEKANAKHEFSGLKAGKPYEMRLMFS